LPLPDSVNTTYVSGTTPLVQAQDLNDLQKWTAEQWAINRHGSQWLYEDFLGAPPGSTGAAGTGGPFVNTGSAGAGQFVSENDSANGAYGAVTATAQAGSAQAQLRNNSHLAISSTEDFWYSVRARFTAFSGVTALPAITLGVCDGNFLIGASANVVLVTYAPTANGNSHWWLWRGTGTWNGGAPGYPTHTEDLTDAPSAAYQTIDITRTGGVIQVFINGTQRASVSPTPYAIANGLVLVDMEYGTSGSTVGHVDYVKFWSRTSR
jgi:hypothetical protein